MSGCDHEWVRAPDRDMGYGMLPTRAWTICFFCRKCLAVETRDVLYSEPRAPSPDKEKVTSARPFPSSPQP